MTALAAQEEARGAAAREGARGGLSRLFAEALARQPGALALLDQEGREAWSGRPRIAWSLRAAEPMVARLAAFFDGLDLPRGARVAVMLPGGAEICLTMLALERAGLVPAMIPVATAPAETARAIEATQAVAIVTQAMIGELRPAEAARDIAMAYFGLRFVLAFGPGVPDGVIELDRVLVADDQARLRARAEETADDAPPAPESEGGAESEAGIVTLARGEGPGEGLLRAVFRPGASWLAATAQFLSVARIAPDERILGLLAPDDLAGLVTGPFAALGAGVAYEAHGLFDGPALAASLARERPVRLVAPAFLEERLAAARLPSCVTGIVLVHQAPTRFKRRVALDRPVIDVLSLGEWALIAAARIDPSRVSFPLEAAQAAGGLLSLRCDEAGRIAVEGPAARTRVVDRSGGEARCPPSRATGYVAERFAGLLIGVS